MLKCPNCDGILHKTYSSDEPLEVRGFGLTTIKDYQHTVCVGCGLEWVSPDQARHNYTQMRASIETASREGERLGD